MIPLLTASDYPQVRALLGVEPAALPDDRLAQPVFHMAAEADVEAVLAGTAVTPANRDDAAQAAVYFLAALAAPTLPTMKTERIADYSYEVEPVDRMAQAAALRSRGTALVQALLPAGSIPTRFHFGTVSSRRGL